MANGKVGAPKGTRRLRKSHKNFFKKLGALGGTATRDAHGSDYYAEIARISHQRRRERKAAIEADLQR